MKICIFPDSVASGNRAYDHGAELIVTPCQFCQASVEIYQSEIDKKKAIKLTTPVVY